MPVDVKHVAEAVHAEALVHDLQVKIGNILSEDLHQTLKEMDEAWEGPPASDPAATLYAVKDQRLLDEADSATNLLAEVKALQSVTESARDFKVKPLKAQLAEIEGKYKKPLALLADLAGQLRNRLLAVKNLRGLVHAEEVQKVERERLEREKEARKAEVAGETPTQKPQIHALPPPPPPTKMQTASGTSYTVNVRKVEVHSIKAVCAAICRGDLTESCVTVDERAILALDKGGVKLDTAKHGVTVTTEEQTRFRGR